ncbi:MAG: transglycosylase SLT domain-containing protein [Alteromonadaceae bacterium]|nr:transglycosylase SLT domain-containing protein [Alteromonadaceae bacterium]
MSAVITSRQFLLPPWALLCLVVLLLGSCAIGAKPAEAVPRAAAAYQAELTRVARFHYGLQAPVATLAGLIHQESRWQADAVSPVGAQGLTQFMPDTTTWMASLYPELSDAQPFDPRWAIRAMVRYTEWLNARIQAAGPCEQWAFILSAYNGGLGWVYRDKRLASAEGADPLAWFNSVERFNAGRSTANFRENRHYPRAILLRWEPLYHHAGWGPGACQKRWGQ